MRKQRKITGPPAIPTSTQMKKPNAIAVSVKKLRIAAPQLRRQPGELGLLLRVWTDVVRKRLAVQDVVIEEPDRDRRNATVTVAARVEKLDEEIVGHASSLINASTLSTLCSASAKLCAAA